MKPEQEVNNKIKVEDSFPWASFLSSSFIYLLTIIHHMNIFEYLALKGTTAVAGSEMEGRGFQGRHVHFHC